MGVNERFDEVGSAIADGEGEIFQIAREHGIAGALFDLGVSSMQLDQADRGFAYRVDAPLDMRMDPSAGITAADVLNTYSHGELAHILKFYGDERFAGKIASAVLKERDKQPFDTSARLVELLYNTILRLLVALVATLQSALSKHCALKSTVNSKLLNRLFLSLALRWLLVDAWSS